MKIYKSIEQLNQRLRAQSKHKMVFTNGVFDIIHPGHIALFQFAKQQGDVLIVGINDDASVKRLKGNQRPIFNVSERMEVLAAIEFVDFIIPFAEDTPQFLIQSLDRVDILVKGGDYRPEDVVGREEVEGCGGKLLIFPIRSQFSTSTIIERIKRDAY